MGWLFKRRKKHNAQVTNQLIQYQEDNILNMTYHERKALVIFTRLRIPVFPQVILGSYIADFVGVDRNFIIELDGGSHAGAEENDDKRSQYLAASGFDVFRIANKDVSQDRLLLILNQTEIVGTDAVRKMIDYANGVRYY
jgi:very-short-patch-repair endonuclease